MQVPERDNTWDWILPEDVRPPLLSELVARIDEAVATARASEAAVMTVGAAAIDAAEQAKRAADLAERASAMIGRTEGATSTSAEVQPPPGREAAEDDSLRDFSARADRLAERLKQLQKTPEIPPVWGGPSSGTAARR